MDIRPLAQADRSQWDALWRGYLEFYENHPAAGKPMTQPLLRCCWKRTCAGWWPMTEAVCSALRI